MIEAQVTWVEGMQFVGVPSSGHSLVMDAAPEVGGKDTGPRPMELLLVGLAGCTAMDVIHILKKQRQAVTGLRVVVKGERAEDHPRVYTRATLEYVVEGHHLSEPAVERAVKLSQDKYCSASAMFRGTAEVEYTYRVVEAGTEAG